MNQYKQNYQQPPYGPGPSGNPYYDRNNPFDEGPEGRSRGVTALLAIFLGQFGVQYFYIGKWQAGIYTILLTLVTCGMWYLISLIQGIMMLCITNQQFRAKYITTPSEFPIF